MVRLEFDSRFKRAGQSVSETYQLKTKHKRATTLERRVLTLELFSSEGGCFETEKEKRVENHTLELRGAFDGTIVNSLSLKSKELSFCL